VAGCDREGLADAAEDPAHLVAGGRGDAEHVEAAVDEPEPWVHRHRDGRGPEGAGVGGALIAERVVLGDGEDGRGQAGEVGVQYRGDPGVGRVHAGWEVVAHAPAQLVAGDVVAVRVIA